MGTYGRPCRLGLLSRRSVVAIDRMQRWYQYRRIVNKPALRGRVSWASTIAVVVFAVTGSLPVYTAEPSKPALDPPELVCTWTEGPQLSPDGKRCDGVVHCRRAKGYSFMPLVRRVSCPAVSGRCNAELCARLSLATENMQPRE